jgi:hypothetical protein
MTKLPGDVISIIYTYEHQLRYSDVMRELLLSKIQCVFNVQFNQALHMKYRLPCGSLRPCITIDRIEVSTSELLQKIRERQNYFFI